MGQLIKTENKRVNIISHAIVNETKEVIQQGGILMRTTRSYVEKCVTTGTHSYTTKKKLKSFLRKDMRLYRNERTLSNLKIDLSKIGDVKGMKQGKTDEEQKRWRTHKNSRITTDSYTGKTYLALWRKDVDVIMVSKDEVDERTGMPKEHTMPQGRHQILIVRFPN